MEWRNTSGRYGLVAVILHWFTAIAVIGLFTLGLWMVELDYYDPWYRKAPDIHKGIGVLLAISLLLRLAWRFTNPQPDPVPGHSPMERRLARLVHGSLYLLLLLTVSAGYLISTADGRAVNVFGLFSLPATVQGLENQEDIAGIVHLGLAIILIALAGLHALAALKHHFVDRDPTLLRVLGRSASNTAKPLSGENR